MDTTINYDWDLSSEEKNPAEIKDTVLEQNFFEPTEQEDMLWQARTGLNMDTLCAAVETIIFMSDRPISIQKLKLQIDEELPLRVLHEALSLLQARYEEKIHGIRLVEVAEGYQYRTKASYSKYVQNLFKMNSLVLTPSALEVLAIIAYKQPVARTEVDRIRGVDSSHIVRALMDKRLVKISGRSEDMGRPSLFSTTDEFLEVFNLKDINALPPEFELNEMINKNTVGSISDIKDVVMRGDQKARFTQDEIVELDELAQAISAISSDTSFTEMLKSENKKKLDDQSSPRKSAFDLLEEFINLEEAQKQNERATHSETLMSVVEAKVIDPSLATTQMLNAPEVDTDLELLQKHQAIESWEGEGFADEAQALGLALDKAFEGLMKDSEELVHDFGEELNSLDLSIGDTVLKGKDLDMDLSFLNELKDENQIDQ